MDNNSIKENIRRIRKSRKLTQEELAHQLGISLTAYRDLEKGATTIVNGHIPKIAEITGSSVEEIVLGYNPQPADSRLEDERQEYGNKMSTLTRRIADLEKIVESLEETVESKNEIIAMLKKIIDEKG